MLLKLKVLKTLKHYYIILGVTEFSNENKKCKFKNVKNKFNTSKMLKKNEKNFFFKNNKNV